MMQDPVGKARSRDYPALRIVDGEAAEAAARRPLLKDGARHRRQPIFEIGEEPGHRRALSFAPGGLPDREEQVVRLGNIVEGNGIAPHRH